MMRKKAKGFSLIELLIVVAIILIIAAIAIPDLLKSRQAAQQASAVGSLRTINTSEVTYSSTYGGFSPDLNSLDHQEVSPSTSAAAGLIDNALGVTHVKSGYTFLYTAGTPDASGKINSYTIAANPIAGVGNGNFYFTDTSGVIRQNTSQQATSTDNPLAG